MTSEQLADHRIRNIKLLIAGKTDLTQLKTDRLRQVHLDLLQNAVQNRQLSIVHSGSAIGEAALLSRATREVERRKRRDFVLWKLVIRQSRCREWTSHIRSVRDLEQQLMMLASRNISD